MTRLRVSLSIVLTASATLTVLSSPASARSGSCGWSVVTGPSLNPYINDVDGLSASDIWAVGSNEGFNESLTLHYDGSLWSVVPSPSPGTNNVLYSVAMIASDDVWAVGSMLDQESQPFVVHWDGAQWTEVPTPPPSGRSTVLLGVDAAGPDDVWAVGYGSSNGGARYHSVAEHWDGSSWSIVPTPRPRHHRESQLLAIKAFPADDVWAVGSWTHRVEERRTLTEHWDGTAWSVVPGGPGTQPLTFLDAVDGIAPNDLWAVGATGDPTGGSDVRAQHWDGASWTVVPSVNPSGFENWLADVSGVATDDVWSVGVIYGGFGTEAETLTEHWDGQAWARIDSPNVELGNYLSGVAAVASDDVWAVGESVAENGTTDTLILHYACA